MELYIESAHVFQAKMKVLAASQHKMRNIHILIEITLMDHAL